MVLGVRRPGHHGDSESPRRARSLGEQLGIDTTAEELPEG